jgi:hypothetical protein
MIRDGQLAAMLREWDVDLTPNAIDMLQNMLRVNPDNRLCTEDLLQHPWMLEADSI